MYCLNAHMPTFLPQSIYAAHFKQFVSDLMLFSMKQAVGATF